MPRARVNGLTDEQKWKVLHRDRTDPGTWKYTAYDIRKWMQEVLPDYGWLLSETKDFAGLRTRQFYFPFEAIMPQDPTDKASTIKWLEDTIDDLLEFKDEIRNYIKNLELVRDIVRTQGVSYLKRRR